MTNDQLTVTSPAADTKLTVTPEAAMKVREFAGEDAEETYLRIGVLGGGCSGFKYQLAFDVPTDEDERFEDEGVTVVIDPASLPYLRGVTVDFEDGLNGAGFRIDNPNAVAACGCGSSFRMTEEIGGCGPEAEEAL
jgi:iron-sulfur cluster assembly protein